MMSQYLTICQMLQLSLVNKDLNHEVHKQKHWPSMVKVSCFNCDESTNKNR